MYVMDVFKIAVSLSLFFVFSVKIFNFNTKLVKKVDLSQFLSGRVVNIFKFPFLYQSLIFLLNNS